VERQKKEIQNRGTEAERERDREELGQQPEKQKRKGESERRTCMSLLSGK
jgi:hypothetical protein